MKFLTPLSSVLLLGLTYVSWAGPISIQVLGPDKKPVPGAQIRVRSFGRSDFLQKDAPLATVAHAEGLEVINMPDEAVGRGGEVGAATVWSPGLSMVSATLREGHNSIVLEASGVARGLVVDEKAQPVANVLVRVIGLNRAQDDARFALPTCFIAASDAGVSQVRTDASGRWSVSLAPLGGLVSVELADEKFVRAAASARALALDAPFDWAPIEAASRVVAQAPAVVPEDMSLRMRQKFNQDGVLVARAGASISGRVLDPRGAPVAGVWVMADSSVNAFSLTNIEQTNGKGEFRIARLLGGSSALRTLLLGAAQKIAWVPGEAVKVSVADGAGAGAPELKMIQGGTIEVRLLDEATGQGIQGASVGSQAGLADISGFMPSQPTDGMGRTLLRVPSGKRNVTMFAPPGDYLAPEHSSFIDGTPVEVKIGEVARVLWKLRKGLPGAGRFVDEKGQPVPGVTVSFGPSRPDAWAQERTVRSDQAGRWSVGNFEAGVWKPSAEGDEWRVVSPQQISLPLNGAQDIVLAPVARVPIGGRVVDGEGKPLAGVHVSLKISIAQGSYGSETGRAATTGEDGAWRVEDVPEIAQSIGIQAARPGYAVERAPKATKTENVWAASEAVLNLRDAHLSGQILSAGGQPAANAQVLVASTRALASADETGRWKLGELPRGEVEVVAVAGAQAGVATTNAPRDAVSLKLKAPQVLAERDVDRAQAVLEDAWETSRGSQYSERDTLPAVLAMGDPDAALALAQGADKKPTSASVFQIVRVLARRGDAAAELDPESPGRARRPLRARAGAVSGGRIAGRQGRRSGAQVDGPGAHELRGLEGRQAARSERAAARCSGRAAQGSGRFGSVRAGAGSGRERRGRQRLQQPLAPGAGCVSVQ